MGLEITTDSALPEAVAGQLYSMQFSAMGGEPPYWWDWSDNFIEDIPPGLSLSTNTGMLLGVPTTPGEYAFDVTVTDADEDFDIQVFTLVVNSTGALRIVTQSLPSPVMGMAYRAAIAVDGGKRPYRFSLEAGGLPAGLALSTNTGEIVGTPESEGEAPCTVRVQDALGSNAVHEYLINVEPAETNTLRIATLTLPYGRAGSEYDYALQSEGGVQPCSWEVIEGMLPTGIVLYAGSGILHGTPSQTGLFWFVVRATDAGMGKAEQLLELAIEPVELAFGTAGLPPAVQSNAYEVAIAAVGGVQPYHWAVVEGAPPPGLSLLGDTGLLGGTPALTGVYWFVIRVTDASSIAPGSVDRLFTVKVFTQDEALNFLTQTLPDAVRLDAYHEQIRLSGGTPPYRWELSTGTLPPGLTLSTNTGSILGTPSTTGQYSFMISAIDSDNWTISRFFSIKVPETAGPLSIDTAGLDDAWIGIDYEETLCASGGRKPYSWQVTEGTLPPGLSLASNGTIAGMPFENGAWAFSVKVTDLSGDQSLRGYVLRVFTDELPAIMTEELPCAQAGLAYHAALEATGGNPPYTWKLTDGELPPGLSLSSDGIIQGIPAAGSPSDSYVFDIELVDDAGLAESTCLELDIDNLRFVEMPGVRVSINWNWDWYDRDSIRVRFKAFVPPGIGLFGADTELEVSLAGYTAFSGDEKLSFAPNGYSWRCREGDARWDPSGGGRMDVPVTSMRLKRSAAKGTITGIVRVKFDDGIGSDFDLDDTTASLSTNYPFEVILSTGSNSFVGHATIPVIYKYSYSSQRGKARNAGKTN
ncbi:hypothetical protein GX586_12535 [bacterium]|nr:hypothetical protein [bacterium]